ncbi:cryptochrome/photolyase family protein [Pseudotabrizicola alkalilacus]|uniref:Deoxyribodipyrimidine photo-lyase n=1 Tax=Pseudotabrizicola alkalilacus TaxID=2305252 RepID=A0A411Z828_9RHOB|nr:deoxyribodipyrimidine photo-lyase [Pseudotabrizicola alkalilacus]RGP39211.1 deoxyribodipyrimidine photo-lyase [Pseudotabrizicola alkalilacus]
MTDAPLILWLRRDLRLLDAPMLAEAAKSGRPLIPLFILDPETEALGAAPKWRLGLGIAEFAKALEALGARLILRRGPALEVLPKVLAETGADAVWWQRLYDPVAVARDTEVKSVLKAQGVAARSFAGHLLFEPWEVETGTGGFYRVFTPFWKSVRDRPVPDPQPAPKTLAAPASWPRSDDLTDWQMGAAMRRGADVVARHVQVGEAAALDRMDHFIATGIDAYAHDRDLPDVDGTSGLSENLTYGEISPRVIWAAGWRAMQSGAKGAETFLKELVWREFAYHLMHHTPHITHANWKPEWDDFAWRDDNADAEHWRRGLTGEPFVDAAMREMYVTGRMHNRARMIVASYLTKHLMTHWKVGLDWFADCLVDWDPASNAMGWQWASGSGPDSAPFFRIFNPATQVEKFDPKAGYRHRFIAELSRSPGPEALSYFDAVPESWALDPSRPYPKPLVDLAEGRKRALAAYAARNS